MIGLISSKKKVWRIRQAKRGGYTLLELIVSSSVGAILVAGLSGGLYIASQSFDGNSAVIDQAAAQEIVGQMMRDLNQAIRFTVRTNTAVQFTVPDRTGDGVPEEIAYLWGGAAGTPLIYSYNNSAAVLLASDVQNFDLSYLTRMMTAAVPTPPNGADRLLLVVTDEASPSSEELSRETLFEGWGYTVTRISDNSDQSSYDTALAENDVVYVPEDISDSALGSKLVGATIGVVNEKPELVDEMGFSSASVSSTNATIDITNNMHYITAEFALGPVTLVTTDQSMTAVSGTIAAGLNSLGLWGTDTGLAVLETGVTTHDSGTTAGRRVSLPWGGSSFDVGLLTGDGQTMLRLAIEWAGGAGDTEVLGAIGHWKLDETTGTTAADSSGNGHDGTYENGPTLGLSAIHELGARFDGIDDRVRVPDDAAFSSHTSTGLTVSAWVKVHAFNTDGNGQARQPIVSKGYLNEFEWALMVYDDGRAEFTTWQADGTAHSVAVGGSITLDQWVHVTGTHEPGVASRVYVDGVEVASDTTFIGSTHDGTRDLFIATLENFQYLNATIDDVRIYGRALTSSEVTILASQEGAASAGIVMEGFNEATHTQTDADMGTVDISTPGGTAEGDLLIAAVTNNGNMLGTLAAPAGWTLLHADAKGTAVTFSVWWKLASASESSIQQFSWTDASEQGYGWMMRFTGHDPSSPIQAFTSMKGASSTPTTDVVTTVTANSLVLFLGGFDDDDITVGDPGLAGMTAINMGESKSTGNGTVSDGAGYEIQASAGDSATPTFALTNSEQFVTITITIEPAP